MPKKVVDYSNTIIYKICCKDETLTDLYVGHTTNFIQRKYAHKFACNNLNNNLKIYSTIRCNGGWENWDMIEIAKYSCKDATEARIKEQEHYNVLKASLNSCPPYVDIKKYFCNTCNIQCIGDKQYNKHVNCSKHIKNINQVDNISTEINDVGNIKLLKSSTNYFCEKCSYNTSRKSSYDKHLNTAKHCKFTNIAEINNKSCSKSTDDINKFICNNCNKIFKSRVGLWKHKKKSSCTINQNNTIKTPTDCYCDICDYNTSHKGHYKEHINSAKHIQRKQLGNIGNKIDDKQLEIETICCKSCNNKFKTRSGLWKHNKKGNCTVNQNITIIEKTDDKNDKLIEYLMKENKEIKEMILELIKNCTTNNK